MTTAQLSQDAINLIARDGETIGIRFPVVTTAGDPRTCEWTPDLSAAEQAVLAFVVSATNAAVAITPAERQLIEPFLVTGRSFLALSQADFIALGQNQRDRMLHDNVSAQWRVIFRLLRE